MKKSNRILNLISQLFPVNLIFGNDDYELLYQENSHKLAMLTQEYFILNRIITIFSEFEVDYFLTLNNNGYNELVNIERSLEAAIEISKNLLESKKLDDFEKAMEFLYVSRGKASMPDCILTPESHDLVDWGERVRQIIRKLTEEVSKTSAEFKKFGTEARRQRKKTTIILNQVESTLKSL